jgi:hypothetical protein
VIRVGLLLFGEAGAWTDATFTAGLDDLEAPALMTWSRLLRLA